MRPLRYLVRAIAQLCGHIEVNVGTLAENQDVRSDGTHGAARPLVFRDREPLQRAC